MLAVVKGIFFFFNLYINLFEKEREQACTRLGGGADGEGETIQQTPRLAWCPLPSMTLTSCPESQLRAGRQTEGGTQASQEEGS